MEHDRPPTVAAPNLEKRSFYVLGGTLQHDASCYVSRRCDETLFHSLQAGAFCYVLTSRQMGKSSLMVRTAARLRADGDSVAVIDLSAIGQNLSAEQWYDSLLGRVGEQLELEETLDDFWQLHARLSPLQRFTGALLEVVLPSRPGRVVIFIDEIDAVRSLPFSTDELFAAIRELYNRRTGDPSLNRLTFCLLGVATPSDLIRDTRTTPFNIGVRIELEDFTETEAAPLAGGLGRDGLGRGPLLGRILHWTGGHPYLTQRLCQAVADDSSIKTERDVDGLCHSLFLSSRSRERDDNLLFVRERLMRSEVELAGLLDLYKQIRRGKRVADDERSPLIDVLRLSGVVQVEVGHLQVRNRIYAGAFDLAWVDANMPDAELRRQKAAFRRGLRNASLVALGVISIMVWLGLFGLQQWKEAEKQRSIAEENRGIAEKEEREARRKLYAAHMNLAQQAWEKANIRRMVLLLEQDIPKADEEDLRGFEWYYLWRLCHREERVLRHQGEVASVSYSPDGTKIATGSSDGTATLWDAATGQQLRRFQGHHSNKSSLFARGAVVFSPDGKRLVSASSDDKTVKIWNGETGLELFTLPHPEGVYTAAFSLNGHVLATGADDGVVRLWDPSSGRLIQNLPIQNSAVTSVRFSPDGRLLASSGNDGTVLLWDTRTHQIRARIGENTGIQNSNYAISFSHDGKKLAYSYSVGSVRVLELATQRRLLSIEAHRELATSVAFSPDATSLATDSTDGTVKLWDSTTGKILNTLLGHRGAVRCLSFSPDGKHLVTGGVDKTARIWSLTPEPTWNSMYPGSWPIAPLRFSGDGTTLITGSHNHKDLLFWDVQTQRLQKRLQGRGSLGLLEFAPDGSTLLGVAPDLHDKHLEVWNLLQGEILASFPTINQEGDKALALSTRDGKTLVVVQSQASLLIYDLVKKATLVKLEVATQFGEVVSAAISPSGHTAAIGGLKRAILWNVDSNQQICELTENPGVIVGIAFSPDDRLLATAGLDGPVKLWEVPGCREINTSAPRGNYFSAQFSPDGRRLATGAMDGTIVIWDVLTGLDLISLEGPPAAAYLEFSPDGRLLAGAGGEPGVHLWRAASPEEVEAQRGE